MLNFEKKNYSGYQNEQKKILIHDFKYKKIMLNSGKKTILVVYMYVKKI